LDIVLAVREEDLEVEERFHQWLTHAGDAVHDGVERLEVARLVLDRAAQPPMHRRSYV
jgi:hypothetical protein